jgi:hypothetical protein
MTRNDIQSRLQGRAQDLRSLGVLSLSLFGSHARGAVGPESDVDVVVEFDGTPTFDRYMDVKILLEDLLESRVDLVTRASLKPRMRKVVDAEAIRVT